MSRLLGRFSSVAYTAMRVVLAFMYLSHGLNWLFGTFGGTPVPVLSFPFGAAGVIETICGPLILVGLFTSWAAFIASGEMAFAYFYAHVPRGSILPIKNGGEITVALCFALLYIATHGAGSISVDRLLRTSGRS